MDWLGGSDHVLFFEPASGFWDLSKPGLKLQLNMSWTTVGAATPAFAASNQPVVSVCAQSGFNRYVHTGPCSTPRRQLHREHPHGQQRDLGLGLWLRGGPDPRESNRSADPPNGNTPAPASLSPSERPQASCPDKEASVRRSIVLLCALLALLGSACVTFTPPQLRRTDSLATPDKAAATRPR